MSAAPADDATPSPTTSGATPPAGPHEPGSGYPRYVLAVLVLVYILNFLDRQIITILAEDIKADLGIGDAEIGFLYGTAFAVFYAIFGIPLGRLADVWNRRSLIALGLAFWSVMTAVSGLARGYTQLAAARIGVGIGEASATPAAYSMLSDSFPARMRATVLSIYSSGIYLGAGLGLLIGGQIVGRWNAAFPDGTAPLGLAGWQAAFLAVGLPGLAMAVWVSTLREPVRGAADGMPSVREPRPFLQFVLELRAVVPPFTLLNIWIEGGGLRGVAWNLAYAALIAAGAAALIEATGSTAQWIALGIGLYAAVSWASGLRLRHPDDAAMIFDSASFRYMAIGFALLAFTGYGVAGWTPPFFMRVHGHDSTLVGNVIGPTAAFAGLLGVTLGGWLADRLRQNSPVGRLQLGALVAVIPVPLALWMFSTDDATLAYAINVPLTAFSAMWIGAGASTVQDLVLPRLRALASAFYIFVITFVGFALGPYSIGLLSDELGDLGAAIRWSLVANLVAVGFLGLAMRHLARDEAAIRERARAEGADADAT